MFLTFKKRSFLKFWVLTFHRQRYISTMISSSCIFFYYLSSFYHRWQNANSPHRYTKVRVPCSPLEAPLQTDTDPLISLCCCCCSNWKITLSSNPHQLYCILYPLRYLPFKSFVRVKQTSSYAMQNIPVWSIFSCYQITERGQWGWHRRWWGERVNWWHDGGKSLSVQSIFPQIILVH